MKKIVLLTITALTLTACNNDKPIDKLTGNSGDKTSDTTGNPGNNNNEVPKSFIGQGLIKADNNNTSLNSDLYARFNEKTLIVGKVSDNKVNIEIGAELLKQFGTQSLRKAFFNSQCNVQEEANDAQVFIFSSVTLKETPENNKRDSILLMTEKADSDKSRYEFIHSDRDASLNINNFSCNDSPVTFNVNLELKKGWNKIKVTHNSVDPAYINDTITTDGQTNKYDGYWFSDTLSQ